MKRTFGALLLTAGLFFFVLSVLNQIQNGFFAAGGMYGLAALLGSLGCLLIFDLKLHDMF